MFGANLVIPAQICEELSCRQSKVYGRTEGRRTDGGNDNTPSAWKANYDVEHTYGINWQEHVLDV